MKRAIVLVSGGMDSCVTASFAKKYGFELYFLHINYGQKTEKRELQSFNQIADFFNAKERLIIDMNYFANIGGSCLTDSNIEVPDGNLNSENIPISYVPFRNANILAAATSWAEMINAEKIYIGAVEEDSSGYPDCRRSFYDSFEQTINEGTKPETNIKIITPLINLSKKDIILNAIKLKSPLELTWSCYKNETVACGRCDSCLLRERGFKQARKRDPILVQN
tara:strand:- start:4813 stop:5481 length:669 start_codon:yes stop_codon:yes gene_type:complete